ncbi:MAG: tyrosine-type recombinase/integrase, partial [Polyangiaceae bacterium]
LTRDRRAVDVPTFEQWARRWTSGELAKEYPDHVREKRSADRDAELLRLYILPHVRDVLVSEFALADAEAVMAAMPTADPRRPTKLLRPGTRRHVAQVMARLMRLAVYPGKWREASPIPPGWLPRGGEPLAKECLYPDEDALLLGGKSVQEDHWGNMKQDVPVLRRLAYGFLCREGMRTSEMAALRWRDVDLTRGRVALDENKTDDPRDWDLRPDVVEALSRWKRLETETAADDHVFAENGIPLNVMHLAALLQSDLLRVGVTRPQLFERSKVRRPVRAHDLRATFVTVALATGKNETWVSDRTGHHSHEMVDAYRRKARTWNMGELGPLHELVPELREAGPAVRIPHGLPHAATIVENSQRAQRKPMP